MVIEEEEDRDKAVFYRHLGRIFELSLIISGPSHLRLVSSMSADSDRCEYVLAKNSSACCTRPSHPAGKRPA